MAVFFGNVALSDFGGELNDQGDGFKVFMLVKFVEGYHVRNILLKILKHDYLGF